MTINITNLTLNNVAMESTFLSLSAGNILLCVQLCLLRTLCVSLNYITSSRICQMNYETAKLGDNALKSKPGTVYSDLQDWPLENGEACSTRPCPIDSLCVSNPGSGLTAYSCIITDCGRPPVIMYTKHGPFDAKFGATTTYEPVSTCYILEGDTRTECMRNGSWSATNFVVKDNCWTVTREWNGTVNVTINNRSCQRWDSQSPHGHTRTNPVNYPEDSLSEAENYCRNPDNEPNGVWCYTVDLNVRWEYCPVPSCSTC